MKQAVSDVDTLIVSTAIRHAAEGQAMVVIDTDTDRLVMFVARTPSGSTVHQINPGHCRVLQKVFRVSAILEAIGNLKNNSLECLPSWRLLEI